jgi:hypothetical protein
MIAIIITKMAATTGTTRFKLDRMIRTVSSAVKSGISREGAIVPETTNDIEKKTHTFFYIKNVFVSVRLKLDD